jgi:uncharacterized membrane protein
VRAAAACAACLAVLLSCAAACSRTPRYPLVEAVDGRVRLPLAAVDDGGVHFYTYVAAGGEPVTFLVRSDGDGVLRTHLDACFSCYRYRMGFVVEGHEVVCRACRYAYDLAEAEWDYIGACAPIPLHSAVIGGELVVERARLEKAARFF